MRFANRCRLTSGKQILVKCPNLTSRSYVPSKLEIVETHGDTETPTKNILCRVTTGNVETCNYAEPFFHLQNTIDLGPCMTYVLKNGQVDLLITNKGKDVKNLVVYTDYIESPGSVIYNEKIDHFENVLENIYNSGRCTKLILSFNRAVEELKCATLSECVDCPDEWIAPFNIDIDEEAGDDAVYALEFTGELSDYPRFMNYMQLNVIDSADEETRRQEPLYMYVVAYGYPK